MNNIIPLSKLDLQRYFRNVQPQFPENYLLLHRSVLQQGTELSQ